MEEVPPRSSCLLYLPLGKCKSRFNLEKAVCNHGFFMMPPNKWISSTKTLRRPLRLADLSSSVIVSISHPSCDRNTLHVCVHDTQVLSLEDQQAILEQVARMLRITDKDAKAIKQFHKLHPRAKNKGFGRIFRSPSLFEDAVKSILLCHCKWSMTLKMAQSLCELQLKLSSGSLILESNDEDQVRINKRKRGENKTTNKMNERSLNCTTFEFNSSELSTDKRQALGNFPSSRELASINERVLKKHCHVGYRAGLIIEFAQMMETRTLELKKLEAFDLSYEEVHRKLNEMMGFGRFTIACISMCLGCYEKVPVDTETYRHLKEVHGRIAVNKKKTNKRKTNKKKTNQDVVDEIYGSYAPFQCIAYWFELCCYYEKRYGKLSKLCESNYHLVSGSSANT